ncbi:vWA domain-containing protein [Lihuaxuella thermophila]|uniref:von Willebrand factor type A domain-containing protein n=1 Tax=Lihuaxuella thermophila TaxID=1173111 RepID=A0A1H8HF87_9BACL|nr:VWA domain-containing protein [Lihuaxuella thermophila]SEN54931.1 von Willebrand factor type A domain-containing protein [Lihuaxuella thermophila]
MYWIQPAYLWLAAWLLPAILLLYLLKRRYQDQTISSTLLWEHALKKMEANRPWQKLRRHLLLWLQLLAAVLLVLGLSRPAIPAGGLKAKHTILLIDVSGSMQAVEGNRSRLDKAKMTAHQLIGQLSPDQTMTLVEAGKTPRVLLSRTGDGTALKEAVDRIQGRAEASDLSSALTLAHALASKENSSEIVLLSDGAGLPAGQRLLPHRFLQMGATGQNVSIGSMSTFDRGNQSGVFARLDHHGNREAQVLLTLKNDRGQILDTRTVFLPKKASQTVRWDQLPEAALYHLKISSPGDALSLDNEQWVGSDRGRKTRVLLSGKENLFLTRALELTKEAEVVHGDALNASGDDFPVKIINGESGKLPPEGHLLLLNPDSSQRLVSVTGTASVSGNVSVDTQHPLMQQVPLKEIHVAGVKKVNVPAWAKVVLRSGDTPLILAGEVKGRRVVIFTFDLEKSDLPLSRPDGSSDPLAVARFRSQCQPGQSGGRDSAAASPVGSTGEDSKPLR